MCSQRRAPPIEIVHFADPWCWWSWGLEPILQRLREVYGDNVQVTYKMGGEFESLKAWMQEYGVDERGTVDWILESVALTHMPVQPDYYFRCQVESSFPACKAFKAATLQSEDKAAKYFRRMMEAFGLECLPATDDTLVKLGGEVGLDKDRLRKEMHSDAVEEAFEQDRQEMLRHHANFDALLIRGREGLVEMKGATFSAKPFEEIVDKLAPGLPKRSPADILEYLEHHQDLTPAHEIASVFRIPDEDAEMRLSTLEHGGLLTRHRFDGIETWQWKGTPAEKLPLDIVKVSHAPPEVQVEAVSDLKPIITKAVQSLYTEVATRPDKAYHLPLGLEAPRYLGYPAEDPRRLPPPATASSPGAGQARRVPGDFPRAEARRAPPTRRHRGAGGCGRRVRAEPATLGGLHRRRSRRAGVHGDDPGGGVPGRPRPETHRLLREVVLREHEAHNEDVRGGERRRRGTEALALPIRPGNRIGGVSARGDPPPCHGPNLGRRLRQNGWPSAVSRVRGVGFRRRERAYKLPRGDTMEPATHIRGERTTARSSSACRRPRRTTGRRA